MCRRSHAFTFVIELETRLHGGDRRENGQPIDTRFDVRRCAVLVGEHFCDARDLISRRDDQGNHACTVPGRREREMNDEIEGEMHRTLWLLPSF